MAFASLCDRSGVLELTLFEPAAERYGELVREGSLLIVAGTVTQDVERGIGLDVSQVRVLATGG